MREKLERLLLVYKQLKRKYEDEIATGNHFDTLWDSGAISALKVVIKDLEDVLED